MKTFGRVMILVRYECLTLVSRFSPGAPRGHCHERADPHVDRDHESAPRQLSALSPPLDAEAQSLRTDGGGFALARRHGPRAAPHPTFLLSAAGVVPSRFSASGD